MKKTKYVFTMILMVLGMLMSGGHVIIEVR